MAVEASVLRTAIGSAAVAFTLIAQASGQQVSEQQAYDIARDAYMYAYPIVTVDASMRQSTNVPNVNTIALRAPINQFAHARTYPRAENRDVVRYNFDTLYSPVWLDLSREPIVCFPCSTCGLTYSVSSVRARPGPRRAISCSHLQVGVERFPMA